MIAYYREDLARAEAAPFAALVGEGSGYQASRCAC